jgi:hypothetical protein
MIFWANMTSNANTDIKTMSSHFKSAISHIKSGMRILSEIEYDASTGLYRHPSLDTSTVTDVEIEILKAVLCRLHTQVTAMVSILAFIGSRCSLYQSAILIFICISRQ